MKNLLLSISFLAVIGLFAYPDVVIHNSTPFYAKGRIDYAACRHDNFELAPYQSSDPISRGGCLLTEITATLTETAGGLQNLGYGALQASRGEIKASPYESSGTSYSQFIIGGPRIDGDQRTYYVSRFVQ